jgi:hypothetical protein
VFCFLLEIGTLQECVLDVRRGVSAYVVRTLTRYVRYRAYVAIATSTMWQDTT